MPRAQLALLGLLVAVATATGDISKDALGIPTITPATFDVTVAQHGSNLFVVFVAPWCSICMGFEPEVAIAERKREQAGIKGTLVKIDATVEDAKALKAKYGVVGFPTLIHFADGIWVEWTQKRLTQTTSSDLVGYLTRFQGAGRGPYKELDGKDEVAAFQAAHSEAVIGCFADLNSDAAFLFKRACRTGVMQKWKTACALATSEDVHASLNAKDSSVVLVQGERSFTKTFADDAADFVAMQRAFVVPGRVLTSVSDRKEYAHEFSLFSTQLVALVPVGAADTVAELCEQVHSAMGDVVGTTVHVGESTTATLASFGLTEADLPTFVALDMESLADKEKLSGRFMSPWGVGMPKDAAAVLTWLEKVVSGEAERYFRSAPAVDDAGSAVKTIVASSFAQRVLTEKAYAFVLFMKPQEKPRWLDFELATAAKQFSGTLTFGTFDTEANEIPMPESWIASELHGPGPIAIFWPKSDAKPTTYDAELEGAAIASWIAAEIKKS